MKKTRAFTQVELLIVIAIMTLLITTIYVILHPHLLKRRARDNKRLSDLSTIERVINEYYIDTGSYPDFVNTTRISTALPTDCTGPIDNSAGGWICENLAVYTSRMPVDPINDATYHYTYRHDGSVYEINAVFEYYFNYSDNTYDNGDDDNVYEIGSDLTLL